MAKIFAPCRSSPAANRSCIQYTKLCAMTSSVMFMSAGLIERGGVFGYVGFQGAEGEGMQQRVDAAAAGIVLRRSGGRPGSLPRGAPASAAFTLKNIAWRPISRIAPAMRSALAAVALRSRCTPTMLNPLARQRQAGSRAKSARCPQNQSPFLFCCLCHHVLPCCLHVP